MHDIFSHGCISEAEAEAEAAAAAAAAVARGRQCCQQELDDLEHPMILVHAFKTLCF